ncbi:hypothetical protein KAH85_04500 [Candidatus Bathyarchaeota archaeon]|nr:hypothetical protein [Candidatus Bathyarchaeota archaeon]MCK5631797.1 hypothetical protein [Candidatus Bathyarchaeota archaeon]
MARARVTKEELSEKNMHFFALSIETKNAILVLISEDEDQFGTVAASVPAIDPIRIKPPLSSVLLGHRNSTVARMLAERLAKKSGKIGLVSVYLKNISEIEASPTITKIFEKVTTPRREAQKEVGREGAFV